MLRKFILKEGVNNRKVKELTDMVYKIGGLDIAEYDINRETELSYLGEYLERHEDRGLSVYEVMGGICNMPRLDLPEHDIFDGQIEMFISRVESRMEKDDSFELKLLFTMFLQKMKCEELFENQISDLLDNLSLNNDFLVFTLLCQREYLSITKAHRDIIVDKLKNQKIELDIKDLYVDVRIKSHYLNFSTENAGLKEIFNTYALKKSDFKRCPEIFDAYKALKKIGTRDSDYEVLKLIMDIDIQDFYFLALKIAAETYADGAALVKTNLYLSEMLERSINVNSEEYAMFPLLNLRVNGGYCNNVIKFRKVDFSTVKEQYFKQTLNICSLSSNKIEYSQLKGLLENEKFIAYLESMIPEYSSMVRCFVINAMKTCEDNEVNKKLYDVIKDMNDMSYTDIGVLCSKNLLSSDFVINLAFEKQDENLMIKNDTLDILGVLLNQGAIDVLVDVLDVMIKEDVAISLNFKAKNTIGNIVDCLKDKYKKAPTGEKKKRLILIVNQLVYMYLSYRYYIFLIDNSNDEFFRECLEISDEDLKEIAKYLLNQPYISNSSFIDKLKEMAFDEEERLIQQFESRFKRLCDDLKRDGYSSISKNKVIASATGINNEKVLEVIKKELDSLKNGFYSDGVFMMICKMISELNLMSDDEIVDLIKDRILVKA